MADKTIGELKRATSLDNDSLMIAEQQGEAVSVTGGLFKSFAQESTKGFAESASADAATAVDAKNAAQSALKGVQDALNNLPAGGTVVINDLTTGGTTAALSAEMGKELNQKTVPITRKINGKDLSSDVVLYASDVGASNVNPNLLHNWYFANPVNQRGGELVVPPNTQWFTSLSFSTQGGRTDGYYVYTPYNDICGSIQIGDVTGYVAVDQTVRRYTSAGYTIDRWKMDTSANVLVLSDGLTIENVDDNGLYFYQPIEHNLLGETVTVSILTDSGIFALTRVMTTDLYSTITPIPNVGWIGCRANTDGTSSAFIAVDAGKSIKVKAAKLELGSTQTLAHQDENGNWILNEIPDYGEELRKCQRYYQIVGGICSGFARSADTATSLVALSVPVGVPMRSNPSASLVTGTVLVTDNAADNAANIIETSDIGYMHGGMVDLNVTVDKVLTGYYKPVLTGPEFWVAFDADL